MGTAGTDDAADDAAAGDAAVTDDGMCKAPNHGVIDVSS